MMKMKIYKRKQKRPEEIVQVIDNMSGSFRMVSLISTPYFKYPPTSREMIQEVGAQNSIRLITSSVAFVKMEDGYIQSLFTEKSLLIHLAVMNKA